MSTNVSTTRNVLRAKSSAVDPFIDKFGFYLNALDELFHLEGEIGLEAPALAALPAKQQDRFKAYLLLSESVNTTSFGALWLFAGGFYSDAFSLLRMIYEAIALMDYGNQSTESADEVSRTMLRSGLDDAAHLKGEWALVRKAETQLEGSNQGLVPIRQKLNNFGAHMSRTKVLGNVAVIGGHTASAAFVDTSRDGDYLMGLDILHSLLLFTLQEYDKQVCSLPGACKSVATTIATLNSRFLAEIRPKLQAMEQGSGIHVS